MYGHKLYYVIYLYTAVYCLVARVTVCLSVLSSPPLRRLYDVHYTRLVCVCVCERKLIIYTLPCPKIIIKYVYVYIYNSLLQQQQSY